MFDKTQFNLKCRTIQINTNVSKSNLGETVKSNLSAKTKYISLQKRFNRFSNEVQGKPITFLYSWKVALTWALLFLAKIDRKTSSVGSIEIWPSC